MGALSRFYAYQLSFLWLMTVSTQALSAEGMPDCPPFKLGSLLGVMQTNPTLVSSVAAVIEWATAEGKRVNAESAPRQQYLSASQKVPDCSVNPGEDRMGTWTRVTELPNNQYRLEVGGKCGAEKVAVIGGEDLPRIYRGATDSTARLQLGGELDTSRNFSGSDFFRVGPVFQFDLGQGNQLHLGPQVLMRPNLGVSTGFEIEFGREDLGIRIQTDAASATVGGGVAPAWSLGVVGTF